MQTSFKIKIKRKENDHTHYIGHFEDGRQFMALEVFFHTLPILSGWQARRKEFVVMHIFNNEGVHIESKHDYLGTTAELDGRELIPDIEKLFVGTGYGKFTDIAIQPFQTEIDGYSYGLIQDNENFCFNLIPNDISFSEPWDGEYDG
jgi:hypothetical protein